MLALISTINPAVIWFVIAVIFVIVEFMIPALAAIFFAIGALVALVVCVVHPIPMWEQIVVFLVVSNLSILLLRSFFSRIFGGKSESVGEVDAIEEFIGKSAVTVSEVSRNPGGRIEFRGCEWEAVSLGDAIPPQTPVRILDRVGGSLTVEPVESLS